ncbi:MAG: neutral/alkaline non-lysosomal ceramidase N-terminal domain-containing protein [Verrucomicrobiae bacterium]|nr:neutral/alkaline non-lysosomal ceramidase N-terminal domain-containing protein [Verrucomicrobiae bacterium]MDW8309713.1 neutral/alkaline non-lysosomal ceramidase N-terminal domain-containing protein [Verrucomicrobiales bacterium]
MWYSISIAGVVLALLVCGAAWNGWAGAAESPSAVSGAPPGLRAGAAASNITPPLGVPINGYFNDRRARHVHDELHARALALDDGRTRLALVVCDSCMIPRGVVDAARQRITQRTGLPAHHVLIAATHSHTTPACMGLFQTEPDADYTRFLIGRIADAVERALHNLAPAQIGWGVGREPNHVFNRRWRMKPGSIPPNPLGGTNDLVQMNPPPASPNLVEPAGPTDPEVSVLAVRSASGRPLALLAVYALHYVGTGREWDISADYFGAFCERVAELLGARGVWHDDPPFVAMLANGASGDINNINFRQPRPPQPPYAQVRQVADAVAREAHRVWQSLNFHSNATLAVAERDLELAVRLPDAAEVARAQAILARAQGRALQGLEEVYARETVLLKDWPATQSLHLQAMRVGGLGLVAIPCEVFVEIGLALKRQSPFQPTVVMGLANGAHGYLPTPEQHALGGYETWRARSSCLEVGAAPKIQQALLDLLGGLK